MPKHDTMATRIAQIIIKLNNGEGFTLEDLACEFNTSIRTIQRDINERLSYLPIKRDNGYYTLEEYCLGKLNYNDIKTFATLSGIKHLYPDLTNDFIVDILNNKINQTYLIKGYQYEDLKELSKEFELINIAILNKQKIKFIYNEKQRTVNPYKLINITGTWYLSADEDRTLKTYTITKITKLESTKESFEANNQFIKIIDQNKATWFSQDKIDVKLQVDNSIIEYFEKKELLPNQNIVEKQQEYTILEATVSYDDELLKVIRYWIPYIKILSPVKLQEKLEKELKNYLQ